MRRDAEVPRELVCRQDAALGPEHGSFHLGAAQQRRGQGIRRIRRLDLRAERCGILERTEQDVSVRRRADGGDQPLARHPQPCDFRSSLGADAPGPGGAPAAPLI